MTYTPGEIMAAEAVQKTGDPGAALFLADRILATRADYDAQGRPIPVDVEWLKDLGFRWRQIDCNGQRLSLVTHDDEDESPDHITLLVWNEDGSWGLWEKPRHEDVDWNTMHVSKNAIAKTRPQLRALIEVMG